MAKWETDENGDSGALKTERAPEVLAIPGLVMEVRF
jgi:hypothetical protein